MKKIIFLFCSIMLFLCLTSCNKNSIENYQEILNEYNELLKTNPNNIDEIYLKRAKHYIKYEKKDLALNDIDKILSLNNIDNKKRAEILALKAWVLTDKKIKANKDLQKKFFKNIEEAIKLNNSEPQIYISLALFYAYINDVKKWNQIFSKQWK